jgi:nicotinamidase-related amidase
MTILNADVSALLVVDVQQRLAPAIHGKDGMVTAIARLMDAASMLAVPSLVTEQNARGLGGTVDALQPRVGQIAPKMTFDACRAEGFLSALPDRPHIVVTGCEAHVCVLQTALGLLEHGRQVTVVSDAIGSRNPADKTAAIDRMARHGVQIVTSEMVIFEWLNSAEHPRFKEVLRLVK